MPTTPDVPATIPMSLTRLRNFDYVGEESRISFIKFWFYSDNTRIFHFIFLQIKFLDIYMYNIYIFITLLVRICNDDTNKNIKTIQLILRLYEFCIVLFYFHTYKRAIRKIKRIKPLAKIV